MAVNSVESRLRNIENNLKALKVCYNTAGSLAKAYVQTSAKYTVGGGTGVHSAKFRFTPTYGMGRKNIISLYPVVEGTYGGYNYNYIVPYMTLPQDGSGNVDIIVDWLTDVMTVKIIAVGTSPGTFTRIQ